ncbi:MAG: YggU family protein [Desulfobulbus propionicus]|nr:MAG: YggU family protein [Desulfobulbus propionicus]
MKPLTEDTFLLRLHVQPRAKENRLVGLHGDALKVRLKSPPVDGKANMAVAVFLGKLFGIPKSGVQLKSGQQSRSKQVLVRGLGAGEGAKIVQKVLDACTGDCDPVKKESCE